MYMPSHFDLFLFCFAANPARGKGAKRKVRKGNAVEKVNLTIFELITHFSLLDSQEHGNKIIHTAMFEVTQLFVRLGLERI